MKSVETFDYRQRVPGKTLAMVNLIIGHINLTQEEMSMVILCQNEQARRTCKGRVAQLMEEAGVRMTWLDAHSFLAGLVTVMFKTREDDETDHVVPYPTGQGDLW